MTKMMLIVLIIYRNDLAKIFFKFLKYTKWIPVRSKRLKGQQKTSAGRFVETKIQVCIPFLFPNRNEKQDIILLYLHTNIFNHFFKLILRSLLIKWITSIEGGHCNNKEIILCWANNLNIIKSVSFHRQIIPD